MYDRLAEALRREALEAPGLSPNGYELMREAANFIDDLVSALNHADEQIVSLVEAAEKRRWISVNERLPEQSGTYLAWMRWDVTEAEEKPSAYPVNYDAEEEAFGWWKEFYDGETLGWSGEEFIPYDGITHWMPISAPPTEEEK